MQKNQYEEIKKFNEKCNLRRILDTVVEGKKQLAKENEELKDLIKNLENIYSINKRIYWSSSFNEYERVFEDFHARKKIQGETIISKLKEIFPKNYHPKEKAYDVDMWIFGLRKFFKNAKIMKDSLKDVSDKFETYSRLFIRVRKLIETEYKKKLVQMKNLDDNMEENFSNIVQAYNNEIISLRSNNDPSNNQIENNKLDFKDKFLNFRDNEIRSLRDELEKFLSENETVEKKKILQILYKHLLIEIESTVNNFQQKKDDSEIAEKVSEQIERDLEKWVNLENLEKIILPFSKKSVKLVRLLSKAKPPFKIFVSEKFNTDDSDLPNIQSLMITETIKPGLKVGKTTYVKSLVNVVLD